MHPVVLHPGTAGVAHGGGGRCGTLGLVHPTAPDRRLHTPVPYRRCRPSKTDETEAPWLIWWRANGRKMWKMWRHNNPQPLQWMGANLNGSDRRELERLHSGSHRAVARRYHPDGHDRLTRDWLNRLVAHGVSMATSVRAAQVLISPGGSPRGNCLRSISYPAPVFRHTISWFVLGFTSCDLAA